MSKKQTTNNESNSNEVKIVDYSEKSFAVIGDTKPIKDDLKKMGGRFNGRLTCGAGWIFSLKYKDLVTAYINGKK